MLKQVGQQIDGAQVAGTPPARVWPSNRKRRGPNPAAPQSTPSPDGRRARSLAKRQPSDVRVVGAGQLVRAVGQPAVVPLGLTIGVAGLVALRGSGGGASRPGGVGTL